MINKKFLKIYALFIILICVFLISAIMLILSARERISINNKIKKAVATIKERSKSGEDPVLKRLADLLSQKLTLQEKYKKLKHALDSRPQRALPEDIPDPLKFKEQLYQTQQRLKNLANNSQVTLPQDLGFSQFETKIPAAGQLPILIKQLDIVDEVIKFLIKTQIKNIVSVELAEPADRLVGKTDGAVYKELPIKVTVECPTENLVKFLYELRSSEFIFIVKSLKIDTTAQQPGLPPAQAGKIKTELQIYCVVLL